jgi:hypothetical protein
MINNKINKLNLFKKGNNIKGHWIKELRKKLKKFNKITMNNNWIIFLIWINKIIIIFIFKSKKMKKILIK